MPHLIGDNLLLRALGDKANTACAFALAQRAERLILIQDLSGQLTLWGDFALQAAQQRGFAAARCPAKHAEIAFFQ